MSDSRPRRIMWLLNHGSARKFEIPMLKSIGYTEIFTPKSFPQEHNFRSASISYDEDKNLTIPESALQILNDTDWYKPVSKDVWNIANEYFEIVFFIAHNLESVRDIALNFRGNMIWRAYGLDKSISYSAILKSDEKTRIAISRASDRFWFGVAYDNLHDIEDDFLQERAIYLPLGLASVEVNDRWEGLDKRILFVCPEIGFNPYYKNVYDEFIKSFGKLPYVVGGVQPIDVPDKNVLGFVSADQHLRNMTQLRVMYYHSREPRHLHYHPLEAVAAGMPLVFMAGGLLDRLGGKSLPGRARSTGEARSKIIRILNGDQGLTRAIRSSQPILLDAMRSDNLRHHWQQNLRQLPATKVVTGTSAKKSKIAVLLPIGYGGGSLRGAKLLCEAILHGAEQAGETTEVVLGHLDMPNIYTRDQWHDLDPRIQRRLYRWRNVYPDQARDIMRLSGVEYWSPTSDLYAIPDDGHYNFTDCAVWLLVSDRVDVPILPIRPKLHMIYDYIQRYVSIPGIAGGEDKHFLAAAHNAEHVLVTTDFTYHDAIQYAGLPSRKVSKMPMLAPIFERPTSAGQQKRSRERYFVWTTNAGLHKNQLNSLKALHIYYEEMGGTLSCHVTGVDTADLFHGKSPGSKDIAAYLKAYKTLQRKIHIMGELPERNYRLAVGEAEFLWHTATIDNGTFSVIEAASLGTASLSSDYPSMREIDQQFGINLSFFDSSDPYEMAEALKVMEANSGRLSRELPSAASLEKQKPAALGGAYWQVIRKWL